MPFAIGRGSVCTLTKSNHRTWIPWCSGKKRRRIVSTEARSTERGHEESSLGQRGDTERHIRMLVANHPATRQTAISSSGRHVMICDVVEASEEAISGIIRGGVATFTREV